MKPACYEPRLRRMSYITVLSSRVAARIFRSLGSAVAGRWVTMSLPNDVAMESDLREIWKKTGQTSGSPLAVAGLDRRPPHNSFAASRRPVIRRQHSPCGINTSRSDLSAIYDLRLAFTDSLG